MLRYALFTVDNRKAAIIGLAVSGVVYVAVYSWRLEHVYAAKPHRIRWGIGENVFDEFETTNRYCLESVWTTNDDFSVTLNFKTNKLW